MKLDPQRFSTEEFPDQASWISKLFSGLNQFTGNVVTGFTNQLTIEDNFYQEIREVKFTNSAQTFPLKFKAKFAVHPRGLTPIYLLNNTSGNYSDLQPWFSWNFADGQIIINSVTGLNPGEIYTARLLIIYG